MVRKAITAEVGERAYDVTHKFVQCGWLWVPFLIMMVMGAVLDYDSVGCHLRI